MDKDTWRRETKILSIEIYRIKRECLIQRVKRRGMALHIAKNNSFRLFKQEDIYKKNREKEDRKMFSRGNKCFLILNFLLFTEADKRSLRKVVARAGNNITIPCHGFNSEKSVSRVEKLTWKLSQSQTIIKYAAGGRPLEQNQRVKSLLYIYSSVKSFIPFSFQFPSSLFFTFFRDH